MHEQFVQFHSQLRMIIHHRWLAAISATLICILGWVVVIALPNQFEVTTKIFLDTRSMLRPLLKGLAVDSYAPEQTALMMRRTLLTRPNLEEVVRKTDLDIQADTPEELEIIIDDLRKKVQVSGTNKDIQTISRAD